MAKVTFSSLKLKVKEDVKTITINDKTIEVKQYLPAEELNNIYAAVLEYATSSTVFNDFTANCLFAVYAFMEYTNISFTDAQKADLLKLYDILITNNVLQQVFEAIPASELERIDQFRNLIIENYKKYYLSAKGIVDQVSNFAPVSAEKLKEELKDFDVDKFSTIVEVARGVNAPV